MGMPGFFGFIESFLSNFWGGIADFITGKTCRRKCSGFFDFSCHIQYICMSWVVMFGLLLAIFPAVVVLLWLLHQKGVFDPFYDWWEDNFLEDEPIYGTKKKNGHHIDVTKPRVKKHHKHDTHKKRRNIYSEHRHKHSVHADDYHYYLHHQVHKNKHKHGKNKGSAILPQITKGYGEDGHIGHRRRKRDRETIEGLTHFDDVNQESHHKHKHVHFG